MVLWGGIDPSKSENLITQEIDFITVQFLALKPKTDWGKSPLYVVMKGAGDSKAKDLRMIPTEGMVEVLRVIEGNTAEFKGVICYPNPTDGLTSLEFQKQQYGYTDIYVTDQIGNIIDNVFSGFIPEGKYRYTVNLETQPNGIYYVIIGGKNKLETAKVVLQK